MRDDDEGHLDDPRFCGYWAHPRLRPALQKMQQEMDALAAASRPVPPRVVTADSEDCLAL